LFPSRHLSITAMKYYFDGTLPENDPTYVKRKADNELFESLADGQFCYVLSSRQTGKSSLRVKTMSRLKQAGFACSIIDASIDAVNQTKPSQWYANLVSTLSREFNLDFDIGSWYRQQEWFSPLSRFREFLELILLPQVKNNVIIFVDEIDSLFALPFPTDDFFAFIRACHNKRVDNPIYKRLTFCLLGVATPSDLIRDKKRTPFNIGKGIELTRFTFEEARVSLTQGFAKKVDNPDHVLSEVLNWTGGQPFLTQKVCQLVLNKTKSSQPDIKQLVQTYIIENWESQDIPAHLRTIRDRLLADERIASRMLGLYEEILRNGSISADMSEEKVQLRLSGLVAKEDEKLIVYNLIYEKIFERNWIKEKLADLRPKEYASAFNAWVARGQDDSLLLRGENMEAALRWKEGRSLSSQDQDFIVRSQELDRQDKQKANQILEAANREARKRIIFGSVVLVVSLALSAIAGLGVLKANEARHNAERGAAAATQKANKEENRANNAETKASKAEAREREATKQFATAQLSLKEAGKKLESSQSNLKKTNQQLDSTKTQLANTEQQRQQAEVERHQANQERNQALKETTQARQSRDLAEKQAEQANKEKQQAEQQTRIAQDERRNAESAKKEAEKLRQIAQEGTTLERIGNKALAQFESGDQIEALLTAINAGQELKKIVDENQISQLDNYPTIIPILALQTILSGIYEKPLEGYHDNLTYSQLSKNNKLLLTISDNGITRLWKDSGQLIAKLTDNKNKIIFGKFSPNSKFLFTKAQDHTIKVWDISGKEIAKIPSKKGINSAEFSPNSEFFVSRDKDEKTLWLLNIKNQEITKSTNQHKLKYIKFSPDSNFLAIPDESNKVRLWNLVEEQSTSLAVNQGILSIKFSPNSKFLVARDKDRITIWKHNLLNKETDAITGEQKFTGMDFSPDSKILVLYNEKNTVFLLDHYANKAAKFKVNEGVSFVKFNSENNQLIVVDRDKNTIWVWDIINNQLLNQLRGNSITNINIHPHLDLLIASDKNATWVWNTSNGRLKHLSKEPNFQKLWFIPNNYLIAGLDASGSVRLWDISGNPISQFPDHRGGIGYIQMAFQPNGGLIATNDRSGRIRLWDFYGQMLGKFKSSYGKTVFSSDGNKLLVARECCLRMNHEVKILNFRGNQVSQFEGQNFQEVAVSPDRNFVAVTDSHRADGKTIPLKESDYVKIFDTLGNEVERLEISNYYDSFQLISLKLNFSPKGNYLAITSLYSPVVLIIDIIKSELKQFGLRGAINGVDSATFSSDEKMIAIRSRNGQNSLANKGVIWDIAGKNPVVDFKDIKNIKFSPNNKLIATCDNTGKVILWNLNGKKVAELPSQQEKIKNIEFSPDSQLLGTINEKNEVKIWNINSKNYVQILGDKKDASRIFFSPDSKKILIGKKNGTLHLWTINKQETIQIQGHKSEIVDAVFSPNSNYFVSREANGLFKIWEISGKQIGQITGIEATTTIVFNKESTLILLRSLQKSLADGILASSGDQKTGARKNYINWEGNSSIFDLSGRQIYQYQGLAYPNNDWSQVIVFNRNFNEQTVVNVWSIDNLTELLTQGCNWLKGYLINKPEVLETVEVCQDFIVKQEAAFTLILQGEELARNGNFNSAVIKFKKAQAWDTNLKFDPEKKAQQLIKAKTLLDKGQELAKEGKVTEAIFAYSQAQKLDPILEISATAWKTLCGYGNQYGYIEKVKYACDKAKDLDYRYVPKVSIGVKISINSEKKVIVEGSLPNSPAQKAGLQAGDIILRVDNQPVFATKDVVDLVRKHQAGEIVRIEFERHGQKQTVEVKTTELFPTE